MKFWYNPNFLAILFLIIFAIPALRSLLIPGFYTSHDGETHTARITQYFQALSDGQFPPRIAGSFYSGFGSPIFVYIYPLPYILGSLLHFLGFSFTNSFEILMALGFIFSGMFTFLWLKDVFKNYSSALIGAVFYMWVPYRFLLVYVRGSLSEMIAYTFLPLTLWSVTKLSKDKKLIYVTITAFSLACLLLSQNLVALITLPVIIFYILILGYFSRSAKYLLFSIVALIWSFAISAITYMPSFFERHYVRFDETISLAFGDHFVTVKQLVRSPWGYGFDLPGTVLDQMSFQLGLAQIFVLVVSTGVIFWLLLNKRIKEKIDVIGAVFILFTILSIILMVKSSFSLFIWKTLNLNTLVDIPWRLLGLISLTTAYLAAFLNQKINKGFLFIFLFVLVLAANRNHLRINQPVLNSDDFFKKYSGTATQYNEFTPVWRQNSGVPQGNDPNKKIQILSGDAEVLKVDSSSNMILANLVVKSSEAYFQINKFYFPITHISDNTKELVDKKDFSVIEASDNFASSSPDNTGLILVRLEKGYHDFELSYRETPIRKIANFITISAILSGLVIIFLTIFKNKINVTS